MTKLINFLHENFKDGVQMFNTRNTVGDYTYCVFHDGDISVEFDDSVSDWHVAEIKSSNGDCWNTEVQSDADEDDE